MNPLTDLEINKRLATAIGWKKHQMQEAAFNGSILICVEVATLSSDAWWRRFDYRDPAVIWPIAERFKSFPQHVSYGANKEWRVLSGPSGGPIYADTAAKAVALAVIGAKK